MLNSASRRRSAVGLIACDLGTASARPRNRPPTMRMESSPPAARRPATAAFLSRHAFGCIAGFPGPGPPHPLASLATSPAQVGYIRLGPLMAPNSGKPEFGRGEVNRVRGRVWEHL